MNQQTVDKVQAIIRDHEQGLGNIKALSKKHGISIPHFYRSKMKLDKSERTAKKIKTQKPRKTAKAKFIDVPLHPENHSYKLRIFEVSVSSKDELHDLMGRL